MPAGRKLIHLMPVTIKHYRCGAGLGRGFNGKEIQGGWSVVSCQLSVVGCPLFAVTNNKSIIICVLQFVCNL